MGKSSGCISFSQILKPSKVFYLLPGKVSKLVVLTNRSSCKTQRTSRSRILCPRHLPLAPWVEPAEPREAECARNVLPHLLPMGMSPAIYPAWACWGMPAKPSWMPPGACLLGPQWSVKNQRGPSSFPQHARGSAHSADCFSSRSVQLGTVKCCLSPSEPASHMISSEPGYKPLE